MAKIRVSYVCANCGSAFSSWYGRCPDCSEWDTLSVFKEKKLTNNGEKQYRAEVGFANLSSLGNEEKTDKIQSGYFEVDRVLGGGFVADEVVLLSGEPGVGKSTLLLSLLGSKSLKTIKTAYISTEEEPRQIRKRAERLKVDCDSILFSSERNIESLLNSLKKIIKSEAIKMLIFDSLQGLYSENNEGIAGSVSQSKEVLIKIMEFSKQNKVISVVVGHITKGGEIAGPKFLEHMVDCVLFLEGEKNSNLRMLRSFKNRYGSVAEVGFFEMETTGLKEVKNPSQFFLDWNEANMGKTAVGVKKGMRIVFATIESLVVSSSLAFPKRIAKGINAKRLELILAILKKYLKLQTDKYDIYVNVTGGLQINDPLADLAVAASIFSSLASKEFSKKTLFIGEVGLLGNIRPTQAFGQIAKEAKRLGFETIYSAINLNDILKLKTLVK